MAADGRKFYWLVFSSARDAQSVPADYPATSPVSQLYMACVVINADNSVTTYPAVYLWNQVNQFEGVSGCSGSGSYVDGSQSTHVTPTWDTIAIPPAQDCPPPP
jgi:hypothetical protein